MKLRKVVKVGTNIQYEQEYVGGIEYYKIGTFSKRIESIFHDEGRYFNLNAGEDNTLNWRKEYAIRDHLGNTRIMYTDKDADGIIDVLNNASTNEIVQENHYYPFGFNFEGNWQINEGNRDNQYKYNQKEWNTDFGLNWNDYGARWYDPLVGRFFSIDPMAEKFVGMSGYAYVSNNPGCMTNCRKS